MIKFFGVLISMVIILSWGLIFTDEKAIKVVSLLVWGVILIVFSLFMILEFGVIYLVLNRRFKSISVSLTEDAIVYNNSKTQTIVPYEEIEKLEFPSIKYTGGWVKIVHKGGNIRLTVVLENIGDFICELKKKLQEKNMTQVYHEKKFFSFLKTAVFSDESWDRIYCNLKLHLGLFYGCMVMTIVMLKLNEYSSYSKLFILGSLFTPLLGYLLGEIIIGSKVKKRVKEVESIIMPRDRDFEQKVIRLCGIGATFVYLFVILVFVLQ